MPTNEAEQGSGIAATPVRKRMARPRKDAGDNTPAANANTENVQQTEAQTTEAQTLSAPDNGLRKVVCTSLAGSCTVALTGKAIVFDKDGEAMCDAKDAEYLSHIAGFEVK